MAPAIPYQDWARGVADIGAMNETRAPCTMQGLRSRPSIPDALWRRYRRHPRTKVIYILDVGGPHTFRTIYMDGREHPKDFIPSGYGHSVGKWEGDTLVVDTVGFSEKFWLDRADHRIPRGCA